ncbi:NAD(P)-binding protein [Roridomyces roridus]|uniref:NAD(P)-binding protein n=1 Tax=Roridomyces roridus TaxID=1738132 RepID=A0AAD7BBN6_9AGAR|nr:NAD(P)-binding protein [Roridomyces roridus]
MSSKKNILVVGATGLQGRALIRALDRSNTEGIHILALTRTPTSAGAQSLAKEYPSLISLVQGDLNSAESLRAVFDSSGEGVWGVFCVLGFPGLGVNADAEEKQGKLIADLALEYNVSAFVFSSAERGGEYYDDQTTFDTRAKVNIERYIRALGHRGLAWTILRPGFFMENYDGLIGAIAVGVLKYGLKPTTTNRMVAVDDIGAVAAAIFNDLDRYASQIMVVSGEITTMSQQDKAYREATGKYLPSIPKPIAKLVIALNVHTRELLNDLERKHEARETGLCPEVVEQTAAAMTAHPGMLTIQGWAKSRGGSSARKGWNQLSIMSILTGGQ